MLSLLVTLFLTACLLDPAFAQMVWTPKSPDGTTALNSISFSDPMNGYAVGLGSVLRTTDGGQTWVEVFPAFLFNQDQSAVHASSADTVWSLTGANFQVRRSQDGGENWRTSSLGSGFYTGMAFSDAGVGIVAGITSQGTGIIERTGNGDTWTRVFTHLDNSQFVSVHFADHQNAWAVGFSAFAHSTNSGLTWEALDPIGGEPALRDIFFLDVNTGWIAAAKNIYSTVDGGISWQLVGAIDGPNFINSIWFTSTSNGWAVRGTNIYYTKNGGEDWTGIDLQTHVNMKDLFFVGPDIGWAVGGSNDGQTGVIFGANQATAISRSDETPIEAATMRIFPNPVNRITTVRFNLDQASEVSLRVYDILGRPVETLVNGHLAAGEHSVQWDRNRVASGLYLVSLTKAGSVQTAVALVLD